METGEKCGIVLTHNLSDGIDIARKMKNRGKESTGFSIKNPRGIDTIKWKGDGGEFSAKQLYDTLYGGSVEAGIVIGHVRYSTSGSKDLEGAHPHYTKPENVTHHKTHIIARNSKTAIAHNGNVPDIDDVLSELCMEKSHELKTDTEKILGIYTRLGERGVIENVLGSYCIAILDAGRGESVLFKDRFGLKPLWIGEKSGKTIAASEDSVITEINGFPIREVEPGECIYIHPDGSYDPKQIVEPCKKLCMFEFQYFSRWESHMGGRWIRDVRYQEGIEAANEFMPDDIDIVTYIPNTPRPSADGYARVMKERKGLCKKPLRELFYKMRPKERSFMEGEQRERENSIRHNLYLKDNVSVAGKNVLIIDDSIVRSTNIKRAVDLLRDKDVDKIYVVSLTPPIGTDHNGDDTGCLYGVDMPPGDNFAIKKYGSIEGIAKANRIDHLHYLSREAMIRGIGIPEDNLCTYCIGGEDPIRAYREKHSDERFVASRQTAAQ